jgi:hypothetical protein
MITKNKINLTGDKNTKTNLNRTAQKEYGSPHSVRSQYSIGQVLNFYYSCRPTSAKHESCRATLEQG